MKISFDPSFQTRVQRSGTSDLETRFLSHSGVPHQPLRSRCVVVWNDGLFDIFTKADYDFQYESQHET
jgi:hypothetical protein